MIAPAYINLDKEGEKNPKNNQVSLMRQIEKFDNAHLTSLGRYMIKSDVQGAYKYLQESGPYADSVKIGGMVLLYNYIHAQLQISDATILQKNVQQRVIGAVTKYFQKQQELEQRELYERIRKIVLEYYTNFINQPHYRQLSVKIPYSIRNLKENIYPDSPLAKDIDSIILPSCELS